MIDKGNSIDNKEAAAMVKEKLSEFNFKDIQITNPRFLDYENVIDDLKESFEALADNFGMDYSVIGLNGTVELDLVGKEQIRKEINTELDADGYFSRDFSIGIHENSAEFYHEWGHALDAFIANHEMGLPQGQVNVDPKKALISFFMKDKPKAAVSSKLKYPKEYVKRSKNADKMINHCKPYYSKKDEMFARAFSVYVSHQVLEKRNPGYSNPTISTEIGNPNDKADYMPTFQEAKKVVEQIIPPLTRLMEEAVLSYSPISPKIEEPIGMPKAVTTYLENAVSLATEKQANLVQDKGDRPVDKGRDDI